LNKEDIVKLLEKRHYDNPIRSLKDLPPPEELKDIVKASKRIKEAMQKKEKICIVGDYDVDGIVSTAIMKDFFRALKYPVDTVIPNRFTHGYGLSAQVIEQIDADMIITVDNGIGSLEAAELCKEKGITLIITDHHTVPKVLPEAYAIINPKQEDCAFRYSEICGAQVAWYLCAGIKKELQVDINMSKFMDLLTIAIIADIMPMIELNYTMVKKGLKYIENSTRPAVEILLTSLNKFELTSADIGFFIAPKINSAGRLEDASLSLEFLLAQDTKEAIKGLDRLDNLNNRRKELQNSMYQHAVELVDEEDEIIVVAHENWHEGVIGIVASKLVDRFGKPAFVLSITNDTAKGSARSLNNINLYRMLEACEEHVLGFGGHKLAAGLKLDVKSIQNFKQAVNKVYVQMRDAFVQDNGQDALPLHHALTIESASIDFELINILDRFEPYGLHNERPLFALQNVEVQSVKYFGKNNAHLLMIIKDQNNYIKAKDFNTDHHIEPMQKLDITFEIVRNEFRGDIDIELYIKKIVTQPHISS
jgi:single-stranded-DNA-specific exonuclease